MSGFVALDDGAYRVVAAGEVLAASDPVVKANPGLFEPAGEAAEQATAAPGERRTRSRGTRSRE